MKTIIVHTVYVNQLIDAQISCLVASIEIATQANGGNQNNVTYVHAYVHTHTHTHIYTYTHEYTRTLIYVLFYKFITFFYWFLGSSSNSLSTGAIVTIITFVIIALIATP